MKKMKQLIVASFLILGIGLAFVPTDTYAVNVIADQCAADPTAAICKDQGKGSDVLIKTIINVLLFIVGTVSVIVIIFGGILYATSAGDSGNVTKAKNTILYAIVGLVVSFLAYAIVNWVVFRITNP